MSIRRPFTANQYRLHTDSATLLQHETDVTAAAVSVYGDRRTGITMAATHACDGRQEIRTATAARVYRGRRNVTRSEGKLKN